MYSVEDNFKDWSIRRQIFNAHTADTRVLVSVTADTILCFLIIRNITRMFWCPTCLLGYSSETLMVKLRSVSEFELSQRRPVWGSGIYKCVCNLCEKTAHKKRQTMFKCPCCVTPAGVKDAAAHPNCPPSPLRPGKGAFGVHLLYASSSFVSVIIRFKVVWILTNGLDWLFFFYLKHSDSI